jgi:hypothetical protein
MDINRPGEFVTRQRTGTSGVAQSTDQDFRLHLENQLQMSQDAVQYHATELERSQRMSRAAEAALKALEDFRGIEPVETDDMVQEQVRSAAADTVRY